MAGQFVTYNPTAPKAPTAPAPKNEYEQWLAQQSAAKNPPQQSKGVLGTLLNNPVGKVVTGALGVLDVPRRVIISGLKESSDLGRVLGGDKTAHASFSDLVSQAKDPTFGVGKFVHTGNKWVDRGLGLAGDIALDPLTYVTLGAGHFGGAAGRVAAATKLSEAGLHEAAAKVGRLGINAATEAERKVIFEGLQNAGELAKKGLRLDVPFTDINARIPGTGKLAEAVGGKLAAGRAGFVDHLPNALKDIRTPKGLEAAAATLRSGEGNTADALGLYGRVRAEAAKGEQFAARYANEADKIAHDIHKAGPTAGQDAFRQLDEGLAHGTQAADAKAFFDKIHADASQTVQGIGKRTDYAPHVWSQEARDALKGDQWAQFRKDIGMDATQTTGGAVERSIHPGSKLTMPNGDVVSFTADTAHGAVSARQINEKLAPILGVKKVIENDLSKVLQPYVIGMADNVGRAAGLKRLGEIADKGAINDVVDTAASKKAGAATAKDLAKEAKTTATQVGKTAKSLVADGGAVKADLVTELQKQLEQATADLASAKATAATAGKARTGLEAVRGQTTKDAQAAVSAAQKKLDEIATQQTNLVRGEVQQKADIAAAKAEAKSSRDAVAKRAKRAQARGEAAVVPAGPIPETQAAAEATKALDAHVASVQADLNARRDAALGSMSQAEQTAAKSYDQIDAAKAAAGSALMDTKDAVAVAKTQIEQTKKKLAEVARLKTTPSKMTAEAFDKVQRELSAAAEWVGKFPGSHETQTLLTKYGEGVGQLRDGAAMNKALDAWQKAALKGELTPVIKKMVQDGYDQIGTSLLGAEGPVVRQQLADQLKHLDLALNDPHFFKIVDKYTRFFKTYATATFGFHARNGMTAAFMNASDGVTVRNMSRGAQLWEKFASRPQEFLDTLPNWITREQAQAALDAVFSSGGGSGQFGKAELRLGQSKLTNNTFTRFSQRIGGRVEGYARMGMAIDTVLAGGGWEEAGARIARIHFDYSQVSKFDATMKRIIPFWTFLSRNVPLQVQQMFLKPRVYQAYRSLARNMGQDYQGGMIPKSWQEMGAFKITDGVYAAPDLSHLRLQADLAKLTTDPMRLLADANPLIKTPFETLIAKRKLFSDTPFKQNGYEALSGSGLEALAPILSVLGLTQKAGDGTTVISDKVGYGLRSLLPPAAQIQRLNPATPDPYYKDKQAQSVAGYLGLPLKVLTPGQKQAEQARRTKQAKGKSGDQAKADALAKWKKP